MCVTLVVEPKLRQEPVKSLPLAEDLALDALETDLAITPEGEEQADLRLLYRELLEAGATKSADCVVC